MNDWTYDKAADLGLAPGARMRSVKREPGLVSLAGHYATTALLRLYFFAYHRLEVRGRQFLPRRVPFVLISNHSSHLDALALSVSLPIRARFDTFPVAAGDVFFRNSASSLFASLFLNALPLYRKGVTSHALEDLRARLSEGHCGLILFPEGTRSRTGEMTGFKAGLGMMIAGSNIPVVPCHFYGAVDALPPGKWLPRPRRLVLLIGPALTFQDASNDRSGWTSVAARCEEAVRALKLE
ncbi:MAG: 1-acyl-sn-glycerol-3-phosphate acyltransferase [Phycisphaeraceae bacterium]|nr:1-acyl-sn-glycerol-3-phosphate acyltransferase [Phycisphaeraceae bacterium]